MHSIRYCAAAGRDLVYRREPDELPRSLLGHLRQLELEKTGQPKVPSATACDQKQIACGPTAKHSFQEYTFQVPLKVGKPLLGFPVHGSRQDTRVHAPFATGDHSERLSPSQASPGRWTSEYRDQYQDPLDVEQSRLRTIAK